VLLTARARGWAVPAALCAIWIAMEVAIDPIGDFPLNDDWAWGLSVKTLCERHVLTMPGWADATVIAQVLWGALTCVPGGFSFTALRLATATWGLAAVLATYGLAREADASRGLAFLGGLAVAANPLLFASANTFMTDTPFMALLLLALLCAAHTARTRSRMTAALFVVAVVSATMTRQIGLIVPVLFAAGCVLGRIVTVRNVVLVALAALVTWATLRGFEHWLRATDQVSPNYARSVRVLSDRLRDPFADSAALVDGLRLVLTYVGFFLLPPLVLIVVRRLREAAKLDVLVGTGLAAWFVWSTRADFARRGSRMPFIPVFNLADLGIGPITLSDVHVRRLDHWPRASPGFWQNVTTLGVFGGGLVIALVVVTALALLRRGSDRIPKMTAAMALGFVAAYGMILVIAPFDRYFMPIFPAILVAALWRTHAARSLPGRALAAVAWTIALAGIVLQAGFAVAATHDYLAWNRTRWHALDELVAEGATPAQIDGGFEFNGLHRYGMPGAANKGAWVADDTYMVAFGPVPGYRVLRSYPFVRWIPPRDGTIVVLVREPPA
jgi:4-amino-4-deoxy-L-arabinose transferase-like glycosyltransferase